jgi:hypothetical protein
MSTQMELNGVTVHLGHYPYAPTTAAHGEQSELKLRKAQCLSFPFGQTITDCLSLSGRTNHGLFTRRLSNSASAIWAGDAGQIAAGKAGDVFMLKTGQKEPDDLSDNEAVQMGTLCKNRL